MQVEDPSIIEWILKVSVLSPGIPGDPEGIPESEIPSICGFSSRSLSIATMGTWGIL